MSLNQSVLERYPSYIPKGTIKFDETYTFVETNGGFPKTVYTIEKGPVERLDAVTGTVDGSTYEFTIGSEVEIRDTTGNGAQDSLAFIDSNVQPDFDTTVTATYVGDPVIVRYTAPFDDDIEALGEKIDNSIDAKYVETASGGELDRLGAAFGEFGLRQGRSDREYRGFLKSVVRAFKASGTARDMKFAIVAAVGGELSDVTIEENFEQVGFKVFINSVDSGLITKSLEELIDLSKPTGVELLEPPTIIASDPTVYVSKRSGSTTVSDGLGAGTLSDGSTLE